jgi:hypothetical protein
VTTIARGVELLDTTTLSVQRSTNCGHASPGTHIGAPDAVNVVAPGSAATTVAVSPPVDPDTTLEILTTDDEVRRPLQCRPFRSDNWNAVPTEVDATHGVPPVTLTPVLDSTPHDDVETTVK